MVTNIVIFASFNLAIITAGALVWSAILWLTRSKVKRLPYGRRPRSHAGNAGTNTFGEMFGFTFAVLFACLTGLYLLVALAAVIP